MSVNDPSRIVIDINRVMLQIVVSLSLTDDSRGVIYDHNKCTVQDTDWLIYCKRIDLSASTKDL